VRTATQWSKYTYDSKLKANIHSIGRAVGTSKETKQKKETEENGTGVSDVTDRFKGQRPKQEVEKKRSML